MNTLIEHFIEERNYVLNELYKKAITTEDKILILREIETNNILGYGSWIGECPECIKTYIHENCEYYYRYESINFLDLIESMVEEEFDANFDELVNEIFEYVKEHQIIGTHYDW
jgi:hypothetical protein